MEEELVNENQPAPKVEKISLAELRAETEKLNENENKILKKRKEFDEEQKLKRKLEEQKLEKELDLFIRSYESFTPEQKQQVIDGIKES